MVMEQRSCKPVPSRLSNMLTTMYLLLQVLCRFRFNSKGANQKILALAFAWGHFLNSSFTSTWVLADFLHSELISQSNKSSFSPEWLNKKIWNFYQKYYSLFVTFGKTTFFYNITQSRDSSSFVCFLHPLFSGYRNLNVHNFCSRQKFKKVSNKFYYQVLWLPVIKISARHLKANLSSIVLKTVVVVVGSR